MLQLHLYELKRFITVESYDIHQHISHINTYLLLLLKIPMMTLAGTTRLMNITRGV